MKLLYTLIILFSFSFAEDIDAHYNMGIDYRNLSQHDKAIESFEKAIELNPEYAKAYLGIAFSYGELGNHKRAIENYKKAIPLSHESKHPVIYSLLGLSYHDLGQYDDAIDIYKRAIEYYKEAIEFNPEIAYVYRYIGSAHYEKGEYKKAIESYEKIIELIPKDSKMTSNVYYRMGDCYIHLKQYENAIHFTEMGIGLNPESYAYYNIGFSYRHLAQYHKLPFYHKAIESFEKAIELNPEYAKAYHTMGLAYGQWGFDEKAVENIRKAAQLGYEESQNWLKEYEKRFQRRVMILLISIGGILLWAL